jgi:hypothetical protein
MQSIQGFLSISPIKGPVIPADAGIRYINPVIPAKAGILCGRPRRVDDQQPLRHLTDPVP